MYAPNAEWQFANQIYTLAQQAMQASNANAYTIMENDRLKALLTQKQLAEDAFTSQQVIDGVTCTRDRTGRFVQLMNCEVDWAAHLKFKLPFEQESTYVVKIEGNEGRIVLREKEFLHDGSLLQAVEEVAGVRIQIRRSVRTTASLLRSAINKKIQVIEPEFFGGWKENCEGKFGFWMFPSGTTHSDGQRMESLILLDENFSPAIAATAADLFFRAFEVIADTSIRWLLVLWFHIALLTSLLWALGYAFPVTLCLFSDGSKWDAWAKTIFSLFGDQPLSLDDQPVNFMKGLAFRCDQPVLIRDKRLSTHAKKNSELLEQTLLSREILWTSKTRRGTEHVVLPLLAQPIVLTSVVSSLCCASNCLILELNSEFFDGSAWMNEGDFEGVKRDYTKEFLIFSQQQLPLLRKLLEQSVQSALSEYGDYLNEACVQTLGVLLAIDKFLRVFLDNCCREREESTSEWSSWLLHRLEQLTWREEDGPGLAERFVAVARVQLEKGAMNAMPLNRAEFSDMDEFAVLYDADSLSFPASAFRKVCALLDQSRPSILRALNDANMLCGKPVNSSTMMTRIGVKDSGGNRKILAVYCLRREAFDRFGDPLVFEEEFG